MKLGKSLAVGAVVAGEMLGGCTFSQYPQGKPGEVACKRQNTVEAQAAALSVSGCAVSNDSIKLTASEVKHGINSMSFSLDEKCEESSARRVDDYIVESRGGFELTVAKRACLPDDVSSLGALREMCAKVNGQAVEIVEDNEGVAFWVCPEKDEQKEVDSSKSGSEGVWEQRW